MAFENDDNEKKEKPEVKEESVEETTVEETSEEEKKEEHEEIVNQTIDNVDGETISKLCDAMREIKQELGAIKDSVSLFIDNGATVIEDVDYSQDLDDEHDMPKLIEDLNL